MTIATSNRLTKLFLASVSAVALSVVIGHPAIAAPAALSGTVSSSQEGKMEGVVVSAKRPGSTIMVSVSTNAKGEFSFPKDRLAPGDYDITMRAIGYTLPVTKATIREDGAAQLDLKLGKASYD